MANSVARVFLALIVALAVAMPAGARAMLMPGAAMDMAQAVDQPCQHCPQPYQPGSTTPDKMPACQALACVNAPAVLPSPVLLLGRVPLGVTYVSPVATRLAGAQPAPDPFPPRPVVLL